MATLYEQVVQAVQDIGTARDGIVSDEDIFHDIIHGPAAGAGSEVTTDNGDVPTVAKVLSTLPALAAQGFVESVAVAEALSPGTPAPVMLIGGRDLKGDMPATAWALVASEPSHDAKFENAEGDWYELIDSTIDVRVFGAIDLTGVVNCASVIQTAMNTAAALFRKLYFPKGRYLLGGTRLRVPSNSHLVGEGWRETVFLRTVDDTEGTIEVYEATNILIQDIGIESTLTTHTLGYGQSGFCARNGSMDVTFLRCGVSGELNRKYHIINSARIRVIDCFAPYGEGNAALRIVSDFDANVYPEMSDEDAPIQVFDILVQGCNFSGASTEGGTDRVVDYGMDCASVIDASDLCSRVMFRNNTLTFFKSQGIAAGGRVSHVSMIGNNVSHIYTGDPGDGGTGLLAAFSANAPTDVIIMGNTIQVCDQGIYSTGSSFVNITGNNVYACLQNGILVSGGSEVSVTGNVSHENQQQGIYATGSTTNVSIVGNHARANAGSGIQTDSGVTGIEVGNISKSNLTAQYTNNGTIIFGNTGTPAGNS